MYICEAKADKPAPIKKEEMRCKIPDPPADRTTGLLSEKERNWSEWLS